MGWHESEYVNPEFSALDLDLSFLDMAEFQVVQTLIHPKVMDFLNRALNIENEEL